MILAPSLLESYWAPKQLGLRSVSSYAAWPIWVESSTRAEPSNWVELSCIYIHIFFLYIYIYILQPVKYSTWRRTPARFLTKFRGKFVPKRLGERTYGIQSDEEKLCVLGRSSSSVSTSSVARRPSLSVVWVLCVFLSMALASKTHNSMRNVCAGINVSLSRYVSNQTAWMYWVLSFRRVELMRS